MRSNIRLESILVLLMLQIRFLLCIQHAPSVSAIHHGALWDTCGTCEAICTKAVIGSTLPSKSCADMTSLLHALYLESLPATSDRALRVEVIMRRQRAYTPV